MQWIITYRMLNGVATPIDPKKRIIIAPHTDLNQCYHAMKYCHNTTTYIYYIEEYREAQAL